MNTGNRIQINFLLINHEEIFTRRDDFRNYAFNVIFDNSSNDSTRCDATRKYSLQTTRPARRQRKMVVQESTGVLNTMALPYGDFVRKTGNIAETVTGVKTFENVINADGGVEIAFVTENSFSVKKYDENESTSLNMAINDVNYDTKGNLYYNAGEGFNVQNSNLAGNINSSLNIGKNSINIYSFDGNNNTETSFSVIPEGIYAKGILDVFDDDGYLTQVRSEAIEFFYPK